MFQSSSDTTTASPTPFSPFSSCSVPSEPTSDEIPDLGAFTTVLRAWSHLQPLPRTLTHAAPRQSTASGMPSSATTLTLSELESDAHEGSTVWSHRPIASYLSLHDHDTTTDADTDLDPSPLPRPHSPSPDPSDEDFDSGSNTEGERSEARTVEIEDMSDFEDFEGVGNQPSLGYLDEALSYLAAERAKWAAQREAGAVTGKGPPFESAWRHVIEPRRKRRRKRTKTLQIVRPEASASTALTGTAADAAAAAEAEAEAEADQDADDSSSSFDQSSSTNYYKSSPATPARTRKEKQKQRSAAVRSNLRLSHSKSTPSLRLSLNPPQDPRVLQVRSLGHKLLSLFPENAKALNAVLSKDTPDSADFVDPRGPAPQDKDTLIHVFIDHSNILIGLLTYLKRYPQSQIPHSPSGHRTPKHLSHSALALILERGRPITRRVLVASSPLYQPMDTAEQLGYEVRVYARVPDTSDGQDRRNGINNNSNNNTNNAPGSAGSVVGDLPPKHSRWRSSSKSQKGHVRKISGSTSTESEQGNTSGFPQAFIRSLAGPRTTSQGSPNAIPSTNSMSNSANGAGGSNTSTPSRIRYREQGVDELLQLKLHQALADIDIVPPDATIVLATGDGNVGQFNEDGFLGPVRTALKKGWRVELYAWEEGLSRAWMREFGEGEWKDRFRIVGMEQFGRELLEIY